MNAKFTPGPWVRSRRTIQSESGTICETFSHLGIAEADANERLIAAAPELLEALTRLRGSFEFGSVSGIDPDGCGRALEFIKDAIAKAIGDPQ